MTNEEAVRAAAEEIAAKISNALSTRGEPRVLVAPDPDDIANCILRHLSASVPEESQWLPIESCPRNGLNFLACSPASSVFLAHWANGIVDSSFYIEETGYQSRYATHWMPLPDVVKQYPVNDVDKILVPVEPEEPDIYDAVAEFREKHQQSPRVCVNCGCPWYEVSEFPASVPDSVCVKCKHPLRDYSGYACNVCGHRCASWEPASVPDAGVDSDHARYDHDAISKVWEALGNPAYDGRHISEHVAALKQKVAVQVSKETGGAYVDTREVVESEIARIQNQPSLADAERAREMVSRVSTRR